MKKYKLIKWYPGLPENAAIAVQIENNWYKITDAQESTSFGSVTKNTIENSPEYWSFINPFVYIVTEDGFSISDPNRSVFGYNVASETYDVTKAYIASLEADINWKWFSSVTTRRDYVEKDLYVYYKTVENQRIKKGRTVWISYPSPIVGRWLCISVYASDSLLVKYKDALVFFEERDARAYTTKKNEPVPIFRSMDNQPIFVNTPFWSVDGNFIVNRRIIGPGEIASNYTFLAFVDLKAAKDYVLENKPVLCLKDVLRPENTPFSINLSESNIGKLRALAQSRLNS